MGVDADRLAQLFVEVARDLQASHDVDGAMTTICRLGADVLDGADAVGVTVVQPDGSLRTLAASGDLPR